MLNFSNQNPSLPGVEGGRQVSEMPPPAVLLPGLCCTYCLLLLSASLPCLGNSISLPCTLWMGFLTLSEAL